ncbi:MAG: hypothetical protein HYU99_10095 [Deltaproteobacteria bacterium]|nr:hypothetical protein [Deltaproteobacteria bacterium]
MKISVPFARFGTLTAGEENTKVSLVYLKILTALFVSFFGGRPHVGAVTAVLKPNLREYAKTVKLPGHHDDVVTRKAVSILSQKIPGPIVTLAGIHYDNATRPQIRAIVKNSEKLSRSLLAVLQKR